MKELGFSPLLNELTLKPRDFLLIVGLTGSGESTMLTAMIDPINSR
jgi:Tfp pilus assembly pilus retraction ATPase PilT